MPGLCSSYTAWLFSNVTGLFLPHPFVLKLWKPASSIHSVHNITYLFCDYRLVFPKGRSLWDCLYGSDNRPFTLLTMAQPNNNNISNLESYDKLLFCTLLHYHMIIIFNNMQIVTFENVKLCIDKVKENKQTHGETLSAACHNIWYWPHYFSYTH